MYIFEAGHEAVGRTFAGIGSEETQNVLVEGIGAPDLIPNTERRLSHLSNKN